MKIVETPISEAMKSYLMMVISLKQFETIVSELNAEQKQKLAKITQDTVKLYHAVLTSKEAQKVVISLAQIKKAIKELQSRFSSKDDFYKVLSANNLNKKSLTQAITNELHCETTLEYVSKDCAEISEVDAELYYFQNPHKFQQPERRRARHILITINDEFLENTEVNARKRIQDIKAKLTPENFGWYAQRHSECPTAMSEGILGLATLGQLHKELEEKLFAMEANDISDVIETEAGLHLIWCEEVQPAHTVSFALAREKIVAQHLNVARTRKQKAWIAGLFN